MTPFKRLVQLIEENKISAVPIVDGQGIPVGIVSESDLLFKERRHEFESESNLLHPRRRRQELAKAEGVVAWEIMTKPPITVRSDTSLPQAARVMQERNVRRLVVVDERDKIVGIVSRSDLLQVFLRTDDEIRDDVLSTIVPSLLLSEPDSVQVAVRWNVVTLSGEVDRKSDAEIFARMIRELDGVVDVINGLSYRWDDADSVPVASVSLERSFRGI
jgi:CBS domain-containing protein